MSRSRGQGPAELARAAAAELIYAVVYPGLLNEPAPVASGLATVGLGRAFEARERWLQSLAEPSDRELAELEAELVARPANSDDPALIALSGMAQRRKVDQPRALGHARKRHRALGAVPGEILTPNERDILRALALGLSSQEAADRLGIRADAVRAGLKRAMAKLGARSKLGALVVALRTGLIDLPA